MKHPLQTSLLIVMTLAAGAASLSAAEVLGKVRVDGNIYEGMIRWKASDKSYDITGANNTTVTFAATRVQQIAVTRPPQIAAAAADLKAGKNAAVISTLSPLLGEYLMLQHDEEIASLLAQAYLKTNNAAEAQKTCERVVNLRPETAYKGKMASAYWGALLAQGRTSKLEELLDKAIKTGEPSVMAQGLILRGDMILKTANPTAADYRTALVDGYLRVVVLYNRTARDVLPEALYKTAQCFDKLAQSSRAQRFRDQLASEFPGSEWASK